MEENSKDKYSFDINDFEIIKNIKQGGFGVIKLVRHKITKEEYATKTNFIHIKAENKHFITREIRILIRIQHPTIIKFRGYSNIDFEGNKNFTIFMDYMGKGSLADLINDEEKCLCPISYDNTKRQIILIGIARGMMILHQNHIIQRDLKPENILLDINYHPRITDFGLSKKFDPYHSMYQSIKKSGTVSYMAPEVISGNNINTKADVYSFGVIMYEIIT